MRSGVVWHGLLRCGAVWVSLARSGMFSNDLNSACCHVLVPLSDAASSFAVGPAAAFAAAVAELIDSVVYRTGEAHRFRQVEQILQCLRTSAVADTDADIRSAGLPHASGVSPACR
jgi:hypothetical protein